MLSMETPSAEVFWNEKRVGMAWHGMARASAASFTARESSSVGQYLGMFIVEIRRIPTNIPAFVDN
jgi:hypothetical protein